MQPPTVSIVMAVYNGSRYLIPTIDSILKQTFSNFEFIIVNDASLDSTRNIVESIGDRRIFLHNNNSNLGQTKSLNIGLQIARGEYIARIDAGDYACRQRLENQLKFFKKNPNIDVVGTAAFQFDPFGRIIGVVVMPKTSHEIMSGLFKFSPLVHISVLMKREAVIKAGGYDENFRILADYKLWSLLLQRGCRLANMCEVLSGYMVSPDSFGNINVGGRSMEEAVEIICSNARILARCRISAQDAAGIYRFFTMNMKHLSLKQIISTEALFTHLSKRIRVSNSDIHFFLFKQYAKYLLTHLKNRDGDIFNYVALALARHCSGLLARDRISESFRQLFLSSRWRRMEPLTFPEC